MSMSPSKFNRQQIMGGKLVPWLAPTLTSTNTLLAQFVGAVLGQDVVRYRARGGGGWVRGEGPRHDRHEKTRRPSVTVRVSRRLRTQGHMKTPSHL